jgi:hypothetical protein
MPWVIGVVCSASATAVELSERTFAATAALIGAARLALTRLMASRSGSSATSCWANSSCVCELGQVAVRQLRTGVQHHMVRAPPTPVDVLIWYCLRANATWHQCPASLRLWIGLSCLDAEIVVLRGRSSARVTTPHHLRNRQRTWNYIHRLRPVRPSCAPVAAIDRSLQQVETVGQAVFVLHEFLHARTKCQLKGNFRLSVCPANRSSGF